MEITYQTEDIVLWTISLTLSVFSITFSLLAYHFSSKSAKLISDNIEKNWIISEARKIFFKNIKDLRKSTVHTISFLTKNEDISYKEYISNSENTRIELVSPETINVLQKSKFNDLIKYYEEKRNQFDEDFKSILDVQKIIQYSKDKLTLEEIEKITYYHRQVLKFTLKVLEDYATITIGGNNEE
ncbi:MAG: hypothetical protein ACRDA7_01050 [Metamycoplasmataceae bacterium]